MKKIRGVAMKPITSTIITSAGTYYGYYVFEGFAADAELFGKPTINSDTKDMSYLLGAVLRGDCQRWALETKLRVLVFLLMARLHSRPLTEIFLYGSCTLWERGATTKNTAETHNTSSQIKIGNNLSRDFHELKGSRQGHKRAAGNIKAYMNPCLEAASSSNL